jgi:serine/threonine protein kinase
MTIAEGTQFGPYRLLEKIGAGGMGEVYRALDTRLEREVALKLVSESYLATELGSPSPSPVTPHSGHLSHERFLREARSAATLNHPNVCSIHDIGEQAGIVFGVGFLPYYAQTQLGLARAYAMGGDKANAKKAYDAFFTTWKDADPDLPMLVAAKKEFAAL